VCAALRRLGAPRLLVGQLLLTYRYLFLLSEEASRTLRAHALRSPDHPRPHLRAVGGMIGQLLVRALFRAERVHAAMRSRGFDGELRLYRPTRLRLHDFAFVASTLALLLVSRAVDVPAWIGSALSGGPR